MSKRFNPVPEDRFTPGLWTVGRRGRDLFGDATRPDPAGPVTRLSEPGAHGGTFHDGPVPFGASGRDGLSGAPAGPVAQATFGPEPGAARGTASRHLGRLAADHLPGVR